MLEDSLHRSPYLKSTIGMKKRTTEKISDSNIFIQNVSKIRIPSHHVFSQAATIVLNAKLIPLKTDSIELCIRIVDESESAALNRLYRKKNKPTNVLAFPLDMHSGLLGDLVICAKVVRKETFEQGKTLNAHFSHMVVHGVLHLLGFDHQTDNEAFEMESLEIKFLQALGFSTPYSSH